MITNAVEYQALYAKLQAYTKAHQYLIRSLEDAGISPDEVALIADPINLKHVELTVVCKAYEDSTINLSLHSLQELVEALNQIIMLRYPTDDDKSMLFLLLDTSSESSSIAYELRHNLSLNSLRLLLERLGFDISIQLVTKFVLSTSEETATDEQ